MATIEQTIMLRDAASSALNNITAAAKRTNTQFRELMGVLDQINWHVASVDMQMREMSNSTSAAAAETETLSNKSNNLSSSLGRLIGVASGLAIGKQLIQASDEMTQIDNRLQQITGSASEAAKAENMIYQAAQRSRASYSSTANMVASLRANAGQTFSSMEEATIFAETLQKQFALSGTNATDAAAATLQLTQALGSGVLRGDELNSVFENAPSVIQLIANEMGVPVGQIRELASEGQISADIIKRAMLDAADETNKAFSNTRWTWGQVWTAFVNEITYASQPLLTLISDLANNWDRIAPIVAGAAAAAGVYAGALAITAAMSNAAALAESVRGAATMLAEGETLRATAAQYGFNAALLASPLSWVVLIIAAAAAALVILTQRFSGAGHTAQTAFGVITGAINVARAFIVTFGKTVQQVFQWIMKAAPVVGSNIKTAFQNAVYTVIGYFEKLLSVVGSVFSKIGGVLAKVPGLGDIGESIASKAGQWASHKAAVGNSYLSSRSSYQSLPGWKDISWSGADAAAAYKAGAAWGDKKWNNITGNSGSMADILKKAEDAQNAANAGAGTGDDSAKKTADNTGKTADNTATAVDALQSSADSLAYLREIAERQAVNTFTTASINVTMNNDNTISSDYDIQTIIGGLYNTLQDAMVATAEGAHF